MKLGQGLFNGQGKSRNSPIFIYFEPVSIFDLYLLLIIKKHWKLKNHRPHSLSLFESQHIVNAFSAVHYRVIRHTVMLEEGFSREMPSILTCHLSWTISQQLGRDRVHGYVTETSFNVNTKKTPFPKQL